MANKVTSFKKCNNCPYNKGGQLMPIGLESYVGNIKLLVFQAPGEDEWNGNTLNNQRVPIGSTRPHSAGSRMRSSFKRKNVNRTNFDITEAVQCYPGKKSGGTRDCHPSASSQKHCIQYLEKTIIEGKYKEIVCFGKIAYKMVDEIMTKNQLTGISVRLSKHPASRVSNLKLDSSY